MDQDTRHRQKRLRKESTRRSSERDGNLRSRRDRRERRQRKEHHSRSHGAVRNEVEVVTSRHDRSRRERSRDQRRKQRLESRLRRRDKKSEDRGRGKNKGDDHSYVRRQKDQEMMEVVSDGEIEEDEGAELERHQGGKDHRQEDGEPGQGSRQQSKKAEVNNKEEKKRKRKESSNDAKNKDGQKDETSPETARGSSEGSTARDDSQSGEEARTDEDKGHQAGGQGSSEWAENGNRGVIVPNPGRETSGTVELATEGHHDNRNKVGKETQEYSDGEIVEDVLIIEDGEELIVLSSDGMEDGELSDSMSFISSSEGSCFESESETSGDDLEEVSLDSDNSGGIEVLKVDYPPCIRMIVTKSDTLKPGSLYIVTCSGGTIGREGSSHVLLIQSVKVSKRHAQIMYDSEDRQYTIVDLGSQNGTLLNGKAISEQRVVSQPHPLSHRDYITIGGTTVRLHIHTGDETCEECEPGQVQALMAIQQQNEPGTSSSSRQDKEQQRRKELRQLKKKFNLSKEDFVTKDPTLMNPAYMDRAGERRRVVGSDNPYQPDDMPASVDRAISSTNLGHKLLSKMGWSEGESLGKGDQGIKEPIKAVVHSRNAGLGSGMVQSIDQVQFSRRKKDNWDKARGRYNLINPPPPGAVNRGKKRPAWVQGGTESLETSLQDPTVDNHSGLTNFAVVQLPLAVQREMIQRKPKEIVQIWDDSLEVTSEQQDTMNPGQTSSKGLGKETDKTDNEHCQSAKKQEVEKDKTSVRDNTDEYERLLLGTSEKGFVDISAESSSRSEKFVKGKEGKSGKGKRQLRKKSEDVSPDESEKARNEKAGDASRSDMEDCNNADGSNLEIGECISKMDSDGEVDSPQDTNEQSSSISKYSSAVEMANDGSKQNMEIVDKSDSVTGSQNKEKPGVFTNEIEKGSENPGKIAFKLNPEKAGSSKDKGKINLKWHKGGKEKLTINLLAFEESESDEDETKGGDSKNDRQEKVQSQEEKVKSRGKGISQQGKGNISGTRRGSEKPNRWSRSRSSSGN